RSFVSVPLPRPSPGATRRPLHALRGERSKRAVRDFSAGVRDARRPPHLRSSSSATKRSSPPDGQISFVLPILSVQSRSQKYFAFGVGQIKSTTRAVLSHRGALRNAPKAGGDAWAGIALSAEGGWGG